MLQKIKDNEYEQQKERILREKTKEYLKIGSMTEMGESILQGFMVPENKRTKQV